MKKILIFGYGYVAQFLCDQLYKKGWNVFSTSRSVKEEVDIKNIQQPGIHILNFTDRHLAQIIEKSDAIISTMPPCQQAVDSVLFHYENNILRSQAQWIGYLSSTGVYGNHNGQWVDENTKCQPTNPTARLRYQAEKKWLNAFHTHQKAIHVFRLSGIYGPNQNVLLDIKEGKKTTIVKQDQYFSRIHVEDICQAIEHSLNNIRSGEIYNLSDDEPAPSHEVQQFAAALLNSAPLTPISFETADLSPRALDFFNDNKKVSSKKILNDLKFQWLYPNYRVGLEKGCGFSFPDC